MKHRETFETAVALHAALESLGFPPALVFVGLADVVGYGRAFVVFLRAQGREFVAPVDPMGKDVDEADCLSEWQAYIKDPPAGADQRVRCLVTPQLLASLCVALERKGFAIPIAQRPIAPGGDA